MHIVIVDFSVWRNTTIWNILFGCPVSCRFSIIIQIFFLSHVWEVIPQILACIVTCYIDVRFYGLCDAGCPHFAIKKILLFTIKTVICMQSTNMRKQWAKNPLVAQIQKKNLVKDYKGKSTGKYLWNPTKNKFIYHQSSQQQFFSIYFLPSIFFVFIFILWILFFSAILVSKHAMAAPF